MTDPMKPGAGDDPFPEETESAGSDGREPSSEPTEAVQDTDSEDQPVEIPWYQDRQRVSDGRPTATQFELRADTFEDLQEGTSSAVDRLARKVGLDVDDSQFYVTDAREAILRAGMQNLDDAAEELRDWGYDRVEPDE